jgi:putative ABC transport system permease protein
MKVLRNILRRKSRSLVTISGVAVGVFAVVVLGALAERNNIMVSAGTRYKEDRVTVVEEKNLTASGMASPNRLLLMDVVDEVRKIPGVKDVVPQIMFPLDSEQVIPVGTPKMILGGFMGSDARDDWRFIKGGAFSEKDRGVAVIGSDLVGRFDAKVGKRIKVRGREFVVVGILDTALNSLDASVFVPLAEAQEIYKETLPDSIQKAVKTEELVVAVTAYPEPGQNTDALAERINKRVKGVRATGPTAWKNQVRGLATLLDAIVFSVGAIALFAGGLLVINTMMTTVSERTREIGVERAMGSSTGRVLREFLAEAVAIGALGGLAGLASGTVAVAVINAATSGSGLVLFAVTWRLAVGTMFFSITLSALAGLYPAWHAARLNPVAALAHE